MNIYSLFLFSVGVLAVKPTRLPTDPYASMCFGYLNTAYDFSNGCGKNGTCLCTDTRFMLTALGFVDEILKWKNASSSQQKNSLASIAQFCSTNITYIQQYYDNSTHLSDYDGDTVNTKIGTWKVTEAFKPNMFDMTHAYEAFYSRKVNRGASQRYGASLLAYWGGVLFLHAAFNLWNKMHSQSYSNLGNSKYGRFWRKHLTLSTFTTYSPSNLLTLEMVGFFILAMVVTFVGYPLFHDNYNYMLKKSRAYSMFCGVRTGFLSLYIAPLFFLFAGRNNFLQGLSGLSQDQFVYYHRWLARIEVIILLMHAIAYTVTMLVGHTYATGWTQAYWNWGIVSLAFGCFMFVQGARYLRRRAYETFLVLHIIAAVFFIVGGYYHIYKMPEHKGLGFFYAMIAVWGFDRAARLLRISLSSFGQKAVLRSESDMLTITAPFPKWWNLKKYPGSYTFIHFLNRQHFHQSHPFTMYLNPENTDELKHVCRVKNGVTKTMDKMITESGGEFETRICLDGPYGHSLNLQTFDELVFVAGGVGITAIFSYAQHLLLIDMKRDQRIKIFWAVRDSGAESWFESELEFLRSHFTVEINLYVGDGRVEKQQPIDIDSTIKSVLETTDGSTGILCCGPEEMAKNTRDSIAANLHLTNHYVDYFEESFSW